MSERQLRVGLELRITMFLICHMDCCRSYEDGEDHPGGRGTK